MFAQDIVMGQTKMMTIKIGMMAMWLLTRNQNIIPDGDVEWSSLMAVHSQMLLVQVTVVSYQSS